MANPVFYIGATTVNGPVFELDEPSSKHVVSVLRMQPGEMLQLTDGLGTIHQARITNDHKKKCSVQIVERQFTDTHQRKIILAVSLVKNAARFEWMLEKATELGVSEIIPLLCERTERQHFRFDRMHNVLVSAMLQSQQCWLPVLQEPVPFATVISECAVKEKFIAHCVDAQKDKLSDHLQSAPGAAIILIGPEGDFTSDEITNASSKGFMPVSLGNTRLRTETAGMAAAVLMCLGRG